jgi:hypothetical protein
LRIDLRGIDEREDDPLNAHFLRQVKQLNENIDTFLAFAIRAAEEREVHEVVGTQGVDPDTSICSRGSEQAGVVGQRIHVGSIQVVNPFDIREWNFRRQG